MDLSSYDETKHQKHIDEKYSRELSFGSYVWKDVRGTAITLGAAFGGWIIGKHLATLRGVADKIYPLKMLPNQNINGSTIYKWTGLFIGSQIGGVFSTYDIWRKKESAQIAVQELNDDVANLAAIRAKTDPDLIKEMDSVRGMYDEVKAENTALREKLGLRGPRSVTEHAAPEPVAPTEPGR